MARPLKKGARGDAVAEFQRHLNNRLRAHRDAPIAADGELGQITISQAAYAAWFLGAAESTIGQIKNGTIPVGVQRMIAHPGERAAAQKQRARARRDESFGPLNERAWRVAGSLLGVMEHGGNNAGPMVGKIIRANGGTGPEPWCGDFVAYCYRLAGSEGVDRRWASVSLAASDPDVHVIAAAKVKTGMLVRFDFDHIGMFGYWCDAHGHEVARAKATHMLTREGNTGASGAVSDSATGDDGVYEKVRSKDLIRDFLEVER